MCCAGDLAVLAKLLPGAFIAWFAPASSWDRIATALAGATTRHGTDMEVDGLEHLQAALATGRGAVLWVMPLVFAPLVTKRSLAEAGIAVHHTSRLSHGFSPTWLGQTLLNPIRTRIERRYLAERIVLPLEGMSAAASRHVLGLLRANRVVSLTLGVMARRSLACGGHKGAFASLPARPIWR